MGTFNEELKGPLEGIRVLDLSRLVAGNMLSLQLADFGAEVIKVESLKGDPLRDWKDEGHSSYWKVYSRNKKSLCLNLRKENALNILLRLVETANVFIESFRPGRLEEMGLGPDVLFEKKSQLILVRVSGFGQTGPYQSKPGFGTLVEAMSGFASKNGFPDREPLLPPLALADMIAGLYGAMATTIALRQCEVNQGEGQIIDLSLFEPMLSVLGPDALSYQITGKTIQRLGNASNITSPRNVYITKDGKGIAISASIQAMAERLFRIVGRPELIDDPRFRTNSDRVKNNEQVDQIIGGWIRQRKFVDVMEIFQRESITASPVYDEEDIKNDVHVQEREVLIEMPDKDLGTIPMHNIIPRLSKSPGVFRYPAPELGAQTEALLQEIGYDPTQIEDLRLDGAIK